MILAHLSLKRKSQACWSITVAQSDIAAESIRPQKLHGAAQREVRYELAGLRHGALHDRYGIEIEARDAICEDPGGDHLDTLLCAIQAALAWRSRTHGYGAPSFVDPLEGWIVDPFLSVREESVMIRGQELRP
jgi:hypothetical protein